ncbi:MAG: heme biosynthesis HemY N-terminal domain-containing protein [Pseudomonadota bacterium]|nr:heme biosynthesis HemY N-terminal domain-containing protein [Pseudomonadota bacterium]
MLRIFIFFALAFAATFVAVWIAEQSGHVRMTWGGYLVEASVSVFFWATIAIVLLLVAVFQLVRIILGAPRKLLKGRKARAQARGYRALMRGMVAVAAGDTNAAKREARRVEALGVARPLRLLLSAQSSLLAGDGLGAEKSFRSMLSDPESEFLGLRGLLVQAIRNGEVAAAIDLARRAYKLNPDADWVLNNLIELETRGSNWPEAEKALLAAQRRKIIDPADFRKRLGLILFSRAQSALEQGSRSRAERFVFRAVRLRPGFVPAVKLGVDLLLHRARLRRAKLLVRDAWEVQRHPELGELYAKIFNPATPLDRLRVLESLVASDPDDPEGLLLTADAALNAALWGAAREKLGRVVDTQPDRRVFRLMARLEQLEHGNEDAAREWLLKATKAKEQPQWSCGVCNVVSVTWIVQCPSCRTIDSLQWISAAKQNHSLVKASQVVEEEPIGSIGPIAS